MLIFILENAENVKRTEALRLNADDNDRSDPSSSFIRLNEHVTFAIERSPTFSFHSSKCNNQEKEEYKYCIEEYLIPKLLESEKYKTYLYIKNNDNKSTIVYLFQNLIENKIVETNYNILERIVIHNLNSKAYKMFLNCIISYILPEYLKKNRNDSNYETPIHGLAQSFLNFYYNKYYYNVSSKSLTAIKRYKNVDEDNYTFEMENLIRNNIYDILPWFDGYRLIIHVNSEFQCKCYNVDCELICNNLFKRITYPIHCTFEVVMLPLDVNNKPKSWMFWDYKSGFVCYIVDIFRFKHTMLLTKTYNERKFYLNKLTETKIFKFISSFFPENFKMSYSTILTYFNKYEGLYGAVKGVLLRELNKGDSSNRNIQIKFPHRLAYDRRKDFVLQFSGSVSIYDSLNTIFDIYSCQCSLIYSVAYGCDSEYIYLCAFDRNICRFVHMGRVSRIVYAHKNVKFKTFSTIYVEGAEVPIEGYCVLRIYFDTRTFKIILIEYKFTDSIYKISYNNKLLLKSLVTEK